MKSHSKCRSAKGVFALCCAVAFLAGFQGSQSAFAQSTFGSSIVGTVRDTSGAAVPGASLTIRRLENNSIRSTVSDDFGAYVALDLIPGTYEIAATKYGFAVSGTGG